MYDIHGSASGELLKLPVNMTGIKRHVTTVTIDADDKFALCGTASNDLLIIYLKSQTLAQIKLFKQVCSCSWSLSCACRSAGRFVKLVSGRVPTDLLARSIYLMVDVDTDVDGRNQ